MAHASNSNGVQTEANLRTKELHHLTRSIGILALLTGIIYMRVIGVEIFASDQLGQGLSTIMFMFGFIVLASIGLLCGWRWELVGGLIAVLSAVVIGILAYAIFEDYRWFSAIAYSAPFFIAGILMIACWRRSSTNA